MALAADVIVVGGGPAGAASAQLLARAGHEVLLLDRKRFPRPKACGECLTPRVPALLDSLGILPQVVASGPARLRGWRIVAPSGAEFTGRFPEEHAALAIARDRLDHLLLEAAMRAGAAVQCGWRVQELITDVRGRVRGVYARNAEGDVVALQARLVIGADGLRSTVARRLGVIARPPRVRKLSLTAHVPEPAGLDSVGEMHVGDGICAGLAPITSAPPRTCNLSVVADADRYRAVIRGAARAFFYAMLERLPKLRGRIAPFTDDVRLLASGPFDCPVRRVAGAGVALVGDAAGYFDPFTGQGIYHALAAAHLLAEDADAALRHGAPAQPTLRGYARRLRRLRMPDHMVQRGIEAVIARPRLADHAIERLAADRNLADALIAVTGTLRSPACLLSPSFALTLVRPSTRLLS